MDISTALQKHGANRLTTNIRSGSYAFAGGMNLMDSPSQVAPGELLGSLNYEPGVRGGYRRFDGYERFDGHPSPSNTIFVTLGVDAGYNPAIGATITESTSGAQGDVAYVDTVNSNVVLVNIVGTFHGLGYTLTGGGTTVGAPYLNGASSDALANEYYLQKFLYLQGAIGPVGGAASSGPVRGAYPYLDTVYAFRDNAAGTAADMWKATATGWVKVALGLKVRFKAGVYASGMLPPPEGTVLTGATSGATFTVKRVGTLLGTWGTDAQGYFVTSAITGTPVANELLKVGAVTYATYVSQEAQTIAAGGIYYFRTTNFNVSQDPNTGFRLYGVNGVSNGFEYDAVGDTFVAIETGMSPDVPQHLAIHGDCLFFGFDGSLQNSGYQLPLNWNVVFGADERSVGEPITFLREDVNETLVIGTRRNIWNLTGLQPELFQLRKYASNTGAVARTDEIPGQLVFMEDRGFTTASATAAYGNFAASSLSDKILDLVTDLMATDTPVGAVVTRKKNMYRIVFASGTVLCLSINAQGQFGGWLEGSYVLRMSGFYGGFSQKPGDVQVERCFLCGENGYLYEADVGRSFDGQTVRSFLRLAYYAAKTPDTFKRWRRIQVDLSPEGISTLSMSVDFDFGNRSGQSNQPLDFVGNGGFWDVSTWDAFIWSAARYTQAIMKVEGEGFNIGLFFAGNSNNEVPATLYGASLQYSDRIINRNTRDG